MIVVEVSRTALERMVTEVPEVATALQVGMVYVCGEGAAGAAVLVCVESASAPGRADSTTRLSAQ